jgi:hypothetical protein
MNENMITTVVKNTSGVVRHFGFLPHGGRTLAVNEEYVYRGDIRQMIGAKAGTEASSRRRSWDAFERALDSGDLTILSTPSQVLEDSVSGNPTIITVANGVLDALDLLAVPESSSSSSSSSA